MINLMKKVYRKIFKKKLFKFDLEKNYIAEIKNVSFNQLIAIDGIGFSGSSAVTDFWANLIVILHVVELIYMKIQNGV